MVCPLGNQLLILEFCVIRGNFVSLRAFIVYMELTAVWNLTSVNLTELKFAPKWVSLCPKSCERWQWSCLTPKWNFIPKWNLKPVWVHFGSLVNVLYVWLFNYFNFERNYDFLMSKGPCILLNKNIHFNKNETKPKMENSTHSFRDTNLVLQLIQESHIKSKTDKLELAKEKREHFFESFILSEGNFF